MLISIEYNYGVYHLYDAVCYHKDDKIVITDKEYILYGY